MISFTLAPELMLKDDGHLLRILLHKEVRDLHAWKSRTKRQAEMMRSDQPMLLDMLQRATYHAAERRVGQRLVADISPSSWNPLAAINPRLSGRDCKSIHQNFVIVRGANNGSRKRRNAERFHYICLRGWKVGSFCCPVLPEPRLPN